MTLRELHVRYFGCPAPLWWTVLVCILGVVPYSVTLDAKLGLWPYGGKQMTGMIERVARKMRETYGDLTVSGPEWEDARPGVRDAWRAVARAAIMVMREPSEKMKGAGGMEGN